MRTRMTKDEKKARHEELVREKRESLRRCPPASMGYGNEHSLWLKVTGGGHSRLDIYSLPDESHHGYRKLLGSCLIHDSPQDLADFILALSGVYNEAVRVLNETTGEIHLDMVMEVTPQ